MIIKLTINFQFSVNFIGSKLSEQSFTRYCGTKKRQYTARLESGNPCPCRNQFTKKQGYRLHKSKC